MQKFFQVMEGILDVLVSHGGFDPDQKVAIPGGCDPNTPEGTLQACVHVARYASKTTGISLSDIIVDIEDDVFGNFQVTAEKFVNSVEEFFQF